ncbi:MAG: diphosphate--fructose-6-phosphate 1-phosphotransferase [Parachlamydiaceae bacterium]|nr:diphosphate--fructose-6-phosphate 1-phosphotransferase [Parachlamydiaceae bacterium]
MASLSSLQRYRLTYKPKLPSDLQKLLFLVPEPIKATHANEHSKELLPLFPHTSQQPTIKFKLVDRPVTPKLLKLGVVLSGGQAAGGHNVISGIFDALKKFNPNNKLIGFLDGPNGIIKNQTIEITEELLSLYRNQGGFDIIGSGRTKIETPEQFIDAENTIKNLDLDGLVVIGGDDSNTNAAFLAEYFLEKGLKTKVIGVPKTIDGDLKNELIETSFGFDTACKIYSENIGNIHKDMLSAKKYYYFIKLMGRSASHITLECALQTHPNLTLIGEEILDKKLSLDDIIKEIADMVVMRAEKGKNYGTILICEGVIEFIPEIRQMILELNSLLAADKPHLAKLENTLLHKDKVEYICKQMSSTSSESFRKIPQYIQEQLLFDRDPHGNVQVSKIETERMILNLVEEELKKRKKHGKYSGKFAPQPLFYGYEGRSGLPSNFDSQYCYALGHLAALLIQSGATGCMCCIGQLTKPVEEWTIAGIPIYGMLHMEIREGKKKAVIQRSLVDLNGAVFTAFAVMRETWKFSDDFCCPGPIQFEGPAEITESIPMTLRLERKCDR